MGLDICRTSNFIILFLTLLAKAPEAEFGDGKSRAWFREIVKDVRQLLLPTLVQPLALHMVPLALLGIVPEHRARSRP